MTEKVTPEKTQAEIPYGIVEYTASFRKPIIDAWAVPANIVSAVLDALGPFGFGLSGIEVKTNTQKLDEYAIVFRRTPPNVTFTVGIGRLEIVAENFDWTEVEQFVDPARAGIGAVLQTAQAQVDSQQVTLAMHIQLKDRPRQEVTARLLSPMALNLLDGDLKFPGIILLRERCRIIVDASLAHANGLFVRMSREHAANVSFEQIAAALQADEKQFFDTLGLEGIL
jgi:hypothetical protein